jgi:predicted CXXCH cytochrome family protein
MQLYVDKSSTHCLCAGVRSFDIRPRLRSGDAAKPESICGLGDCETCHQTTYERWKKTLMANVLVDAKERPDWVLGDFSRPNPLVTFRKEDIAFTYGSKWKQRYYTKVGDDYFVFPVQWDVAARMWRRYYVENGTDWWTEHYPADQMRRPTGPLCDGCHSTNYNIATKTVTEWNVGCEKCHGAGGGHARAPSKTNIVNPARLDYVRGVDVCIQCHSQGQPLQNPVNGVYYDWPVGYQPGSRLSDYWMLEEHKLGEETFTHWPDGSSHKNRMQGNDFVQSAMYTKGVRCWSCHDVHGTGNSAEVIRPGNSLCLTCHSSESPNGPRGTLEQHTHHAAESAGSQCAACHAPKIATTIASASVRSHTFRFISPAETEKYKVPNPCTSCHTDRNNEWATTELLKWQNVSPWRVGR